MRLPLKALTQYMLFIVRHADLIIAATPGIAKHLAQRVSANGKILLIQNSVSREFLDACKGCQERVPKARPIVTYVGLIGDAQGLAVLADVAAALPAVDFVVIGEGSERPLLETRIAELSVRNVTLTGYVGRTQLLEAYRRSDVLFAQLKDTPTLNATGLPSKLYEYMATGKPIVYAGRGLAAETIQRIGCGVSVAPETSGAIAEAISALLGDERLMADMGRNGREFVEASGGRMTFFTVLMTVGLVAATAADAKVKEGPSGGAFYKPPKNVPNGHGKIIFNFKVIYYHRVLIL